MEISIDLNGKSITSANGRALRVANTGLVLNITDSSEEKTGKVVGLGHSNQAGVILMSDGILNIFGGTITSTSANTTPGGGGIISVKGDTETSVINIYGGTITGGTTTQNGGNIYVGTNTVLNFYKGTVSNGVAAGLGGNIYVTNTSVVNLAGGTVSDGKSVGNGGNVYVAGTSTVNMTGGAISGGTSDYNSTAKKNGGSVFVASNTTFNLSGGTVTGGSANDGGGNFYVNGTLNISGGEISGGKASGSRVTTSASGNIFAVNGTVNISGGRVAGHITVTNTDWSTAKCKLILSGKLDIADGTSGVSLNAYNSQYLPAIVVNDLSDDSNAVYISNSVIYTCTGNSTDGYTYTKTSNDALVGYVLMNLADKNDAQFFLRSETDAFAHADPVQNADGTTWDVTLKLAD